MFGETAIINCFFKICLCKSSKHQSHRAAKPTDQQVTEGDRSRVHMHGVEPREIALQHPWRKSTREILPKPRLFFIKRKKERGITEM